MQYMTESRHYLKNPAVIVKIKLPVLPLIFHLYPHLAHSYKVIHKISYLKTNILKKGFKDFLKRMTLKGLSL